MAKKKSESFWWNNGLSLAMFALFTLSIIGQTWTGYHTYNSEQREHGQPTVQLPVYFRTGHFVEAVFENWESEFLQMGVFVLLTILLKQKGSSESKKWDGTDEVDQDPRRHRLKNSPWPVQKGGIVLKLYEHSLSGALFLLFLISFIMHAVGGASNYNEDQLAHGSRTVLTAIQYIGTYQFWFESFQNWQSEFLSVGMLIVLSIYLRDRGSPQSKPVAAPHEETGE